MQPTLLEQPQTAPETGAAAVFEEVIAGNFRRTLATPEPIKDWSLTTLKEKLIKIGAKVVSHGRYVAFQMAEVAIPRSLFAEILRLVAELRPSSAALSM
jgi:Transposase DDE domain group 1